MLHFGILELYCILPEKLIHTSVIIDNVLVSTIFWVETLTTVATIFFADVMFESYTLGTISQILENLLYLYCCWKGKRQNYRLTAGRS